MEYLHGLTNITFLSGWLLYTYFLLSIPMYEIVNCKKPSISNMDIIGVIFVMIFSLIMIIGAKSIITVKMLVFLFFTILLYFTYKSILDRLKTSIFYTERSYHYGKKAWIYVGSFILVIEILLFFGLFIKDIQYIFNFVFRYGFMNTLNKNMEYIGGVAMIYSILMLCVGQLLGYINLSTLKKYIFEVQGHEGEFNISGYLISENKDSVVIKPDNTAVIYIKKDLINKVKSIPGQQWV